MDNWIKTAEKLPPENVVVQTMDSGFNVQELKRQGNLWFVPDGSMYVYYVPQAWKLEA